MGLYRFLYSSSKFVPAEVGVLFLGIFVGGVLGFGLAKSGGNLKTALTVVGGALGGAPVLFIEGVGEAKWSYPVGLVLGLAILRLMAAKSIVESGRISRSRKVYALIEIAFIAGITVAAVVYTSIPE